MFAKVLGGQRWKEPTLAQLLKSKALGIHKFIIILPYLFTAYKLLNIEGTNMDSKEEAVK